MVSAPLHTLSPLALFGAVLHSVADGADRESLAFFENDICPLLVRRCIKCHGPKKAESGLRLDAHPAVLKGGDNGSALVPGKPAASLTVKAVRHKDDLKMPPDGKLANREIAAIVRWIQEGAD